MNGGNEYAVTGKFGQAVSVMNESLTGERVTDILEASRACLSMVLERNKRDDVTYLQVLPE